MNIGFIVHHFNAADGTGGYAVELVGRLAREHSVTLYTAAVRSPVPKGVTVATSADVVTTHIVMAAWRDAARG